MKVEEFGGTKVYVTRTYHCVYIFSRKNPSRHVIKNKWWHNVTTIFICGSERTRGFDWLKAYCVLPAKVRAHRTLSKMRI
jgi:hypothetical protein